MPSPDDNIDVYLLPVGLEVACYSCSLLARSIQDKLTLPKHKMHVCRKCWEELRLHFPMDPKELN